MFNNIIYFLIVLLIFEISYPEKTEDAQLIYDLLMTLSCWAILASFCRSGFKRLLRASTADQDIRLTPRYHALILRLSIFAVILFCMDVYLFHMKHWLGIIPLVDKFSVLQGALAVALFLFYLSTIWYFAHPVYVQAFQAKVRRRSFIVSNLKLNMPILFPWVVLTFMYDLITLSRWSIPNRLLEQPAGQMIFFGVFICALIIIMPPFIQYWWECRPFEPSEKEVELKKFLSKMRFKYAALLRWPIFEGRMMTAGIIGIVPRLRYLLVSDSLMKILDLDELKAVLAHEIGHAKYRHMLFYVIFLLGYMFLSLGLFDMFFYLLASSPYFIRSLEETKPYNVNLFYMALSVPILLSIFIYFRFILGFFMRNFERQADLYSATVMGTPLPTVNSLEKIALFSGKIRDLPSWHHFSIKERVECLLAMLKKPDLLRSHNRFIALSFIVYLVCTLGLGYLLNFSPMKHDLYYRFASETLHEQVIKEPNNIILLENLAMLYHDIGKYSEAKDIYERILELDFTRSTALNNLAWLLITAPDENLRDPQRGLILAQKAVELERTPTFLDTLAEAYWANGFTEKAVETIKEAISLERDDDSYYREQLKKFMPSLNAK